MEPQNQEVDKSILFATEIKAIDPNYPEEGPRRWSGSLIRALSWEQAEEFCLHNRGYLKVVGVNGSDLREDDIILDATRFEVPPKPKTKEQNFQQYIAQDPTQSDETDETVECCQPEEEDIEQVEGFADGDTVMLKSGGPLMTVRSASQSWCDVTFFVGTELVQTGFPDDCLVFVNR